MQRAAGRAVRAGLLEHPDGSTSVSEAIEADPALTARQRQALLEIYRSFLEQNDET